MQAELIRALEARRPETCARWEDLLRVEETSSPLASPDILVHMFRLTLDECFGLLASGAAAGDAPCAAPPCPCGRNPLLTYFAAGRQAIEEALVLVQSSRAVLSPRDRDAQLRELEAAFGRIARREIGSFCAVCQFRRPAEGPAAALAAASC